VFQTRGDYTLTRAPQCANVVWSDLASIQQELELEKELHAWDQVSDEALLNMEQAMPDRIKKRSGLQGRADNINKDQSIS
jgi:hypothetical protein